MEGRGPGQSAHGEVEGAPTEGEANNLRRDLCDDGPCLSLDALVPCVTFDVSHVSCMLQGWSDYARHHVRLVFPSVRSHFKPVSQMMIELMPRYDGSPVQQWTVFTDGGVGDSYA
eukprot:14986269-Alexandrium_andersonii.AAC.1